MSASSPRVSAIVPAYNAARTIAQTLESALTQTMSDLEVIVVDDGSADATGAVVENIADPRVQLMSQTNAGVATARNTGIAQARGEWVAFLDSDDIWLPNKLQRQLELMTAMPGCMASQGSAYFVDDDLRPLKLRRCVPVENPLLSFLRFQNLPNAASSWIVRRELLDQIGGFDPELVILEDWEFSLRLARYANPLCIDEPLTLYRVHPGNRSRDLDIHIAPGLMVLGRLFSDPSLPADVRAREREIYARFYTMLCGGAFRVHRWRACGYWGVRALRTDPRMIGYMSATPLRRVRRHLAAATALVDD
jgi:glycosyltransferase involved in cell wall biosynthesis